MPKGDSEMLAVKWLWRCHSCAAEDLGVTSDLTGTKSNTYKGVHAQRAS